MMKQLCLFSTLLYIETHSSFPSHRSVLQCATKLPLPPSEIHNQNCIKILKALTTARRKVFCHLGWLGNHLDNNMLTSFAIPLVATRSALFPYSPTIRDRLSDDYFIDAYVLVFHADRYLRLFKCEQFFNIIFNINLPLEDSLTGNKVIIILL